MTRLHVTISPKNRRTHPFTKESHNSEGANVCMQAPLLAYNYFVEAVFVLNDCRDGLHATHPAEAMSALASQACTVLPVLCIGYKKR